MPFAFLATYSTLDKENEVRHFPLSYALEEYRDDREKLLELLSCLSKVAEVSPLMEHFIESGELFHPLGFTTEDAFSKQTRAIKKIPAMHKIAMTGTPIENDLTNLWSLFDFLNKGLLGSSQEFREYARTLDNHSEGYEKLRNMITPFILRRMKSDKRIIADLPDKVEKKELIPFLEKFLATIFGSGGLVIHGGVPPKKRQKSRDDAKLLTK